LRECAFVAKIVQQIPATASKRSTSQPSISVRQSRRPEVTGSHAFLGILRASVRSVLVFPSLKRIITVS
jgi:hypothetical protein